MNFAYTILYVDDVLKSVEFYEQAFALKRRFIAEGNGYAEMESGHTTLSFSSRTFAKASGLDFGQLASSPMQAPFELAFVAHDVDEAFATAVASGAEVLQKPVQKPWGQRVGYVRDCNGFLVEICSPMA